MRHRVAWVWAFLVSVQKKRSRPCAVDLAFHLRLRPQPIFLELPDALRDLGTALVRSLQRLALRFLVGLARCEPRFQLRGLGLQRRELRLDRREALFERLARIGLALALRSLGAALFLAGHRGRFAR